MIQFKRILMAAADEAGGSGNGAATAGAPTAENVSQAQGTPVISKEIEDYIESKVATKMKAERDAIFAEARRTFTEKRNKPKDEAPSGNQNASNALDPHEERRVLRDFDRNMTRLGLADKVNPNQWSRAEKALLAERPDDVQSWLKDYFDGFGISPGAAPAAQQTPAQSQAAPAQPPKPSNEHPESARGGSPATKSPLVEADLLSMSESDRAALIKEKGYRWYSQQLTKALGNVVVDVGRR